MFFISIIFVLVLFLIISFIILPINTIYNNIINNYEDELFNICKMTMNNFITMHSINKIRKEDEYYIIDKIIDLAIRNIKMHSNIFKNIMFKYILSNGYNFIFRDQIQKTICKLYKEKINDKIFFGFGITASGVDYKTDFYRKEINLLPKEEEHIEINEINFNVDNNIKIKNIINTEDIQEENEMYIL